jgi:hypothetical protein
VNPATGTEERKFFLSQEEKSQRGEDLARCYQKLAELRSGLAELKLEYKTAMQAVERAIDQYSQAINNGYEYRTVDLQNKMFGDTVLEEVGDRINSGELGDSVTYHATARGANA